MENRPLDKVVRPVVWVRLIGKSVPEWLEALLSGLEEEGIPAEVQNGADGVFLEAAAWEAARSTPLGVGLALNFMEKKAVLHHRDLPQDHPVLRLDPEFFEAKELRLLGCNAARLVKGEPFVFDNRSRRVGGESHDDPAVPEELLAIVTAIVRHLLECRERHG
ncbi:glycerol dehydratase reactivase beta/small subunit family protein [Desulfosoma sp.]